MIKKIFHQKLKIGLLEGLIKFPIQIFLYRLTGSPDSTQTSNFKNILIHTDYKNMKIETQS